MGPDSELGTGPDAGTGFGANEAEMHGAGRATETAGAPSKPEVLAWIVTIGLALAAISVVVASTSWRMQLDTPLLHYMGFMLDQGAVPYRDIYVTSFPGAMLFHLGILKLGGHGDGPFVIANLLWLGLTLVLTWNILARFGKRAAIAGCALFTLAYLHDGPTIVLQRDFALIPFLAAALCIQLSTRGRLPARAFGMGLCIALAMSIKPHAGIGLPLLLWAEWRRRTEAGQAGAMLAEWRGLILWAGLGLALPLGAIGLWLAATGGLQPFLEIAREYLPLHVSLSRTHQQLDGDRRLLYIAYNTSLFGRTPGWLIATAVGAFAAFSAGSLDRSRRRLVATLGGMAFLYCIYVVLAGQFWNYHWMPFKYFCCLLAGLCLMPFEGLPKGALARSMPPAAAVLSIIAVLPFAPEYVARLQGLPLPPPDGGRVDTIATYLEEHLEAGDTVQPFDWASGGVHALLQAKATIATPYISDYHFYHHVESDYIKELRSRFIGDLTQAPPRFLVDVAIRPIPKGEGCSTDFPELTALIQASYETVLDGPGWRVLERKRD